MCQPRYRGGNGFISYAGGVWQPEHPAEAYRDDRVGQDSMRCPFERERLRQPDDPHLRCRVVCLAAVTVKTRRRRYVDDATVALADHERPRMLGYPEWSAQIDIDDFRPVCGTQPWHVRIAQNPGVVDDDIDTAERLQREL